MAEAPACTFSATGDNKTVRISNIPILVSRTVLQKYLKDQLDKRFGTLAEDNDGNLYISLAPDASAEDCQRFQVATMTFSRLVDVPSVVILGPGAGFKGTVDIHFRGLTTLNNPEDPTIDIIAVTGLAGHAFGSWRSRDWPEMWLRDLLPQDMEHKGHRARVLTYGYDTTLNGSHSHAGVNDHSKQFLEAVKGARATDPSRPLIFIGHSLGGLVIKQAIVVSFRESQESSLVRSCAGMLFFSVPHKGLAGASLIPMVNGQPNEGLVHDLCGNSDYLRSLDQSFGQIAPNGIGFKIVSFYETRETQTVKEVSPSVWKKCGPYVRMVDEESVKHAGNGEYLSMEADHSSIVKFSDRSDQNYQRARSKLLEIADAIPTPPPESAAASDERIKICQWLYPGVFDEIHVDISGKRQNDTGGWLLSDHKFASWRNKSGPPLLWGCGIPGAGKTFLCSLVIDVLNVRSSKRTSTTGLAYIYFNYKDLSQQKPVTVLRNLIKQLITKPPALKVPIPKQIKSLYNANCAADSMPKAQELQDALIASLMLFTETFFVFDALDECPEDIRKDLLPLIHWIVGSGARVFLTSRPYPQDIAVSLTPTVLNSHIERLDLAAKKEDVMIYIEKSIKEHIKARDLITGDLRATVVSRLVEACKGMFLLVHFYIEDLCQYPTSKQVRHALRNINSTLGTENALNGTYSRAIKSIRAQHGSRATLALRTLAWLLSAHRPLSIGELRMAVAMDGYGSSHEGADADVFDEADIPDEASILDVCCGLVIIEHKSGTIKLAHYSVQEYLEGTCAIGDLASRHLTVALGCLGLASTLATLTTLWGGVEAPLYDGLMEYVSSNLHRHMQRCHHIAPTGTLLKFLRDADLLEMLVNMPERLHPWWYSDREISHALPLHEATAWGSTALVSHLLEDKADHLVDQNRYTPLHVAAQENLADLVEFWLENGVEVDARSTDRKTALHCAIRAGSIGAARLLLSRGADPETAALAPQEYITNMSIDMLELLLKSRLSLEHRGWEMLQDAVQSCEALHVELLLRHGVRTQVPSDRDRLELLHEAVERGNKDVVRSLLQHGYWVGGVEVEIDGEDNDDETWFWGRNSRGNLASPRHIPGETPLHLAVRGAHIDILRLLVDHVRGPGGASLSLSPPSSSGGHVLAPSVIDSRDINGHTPLSFALHFGGERRERNAALMSTLLDAGANPNVPSSISRDDILHEAAKDGDIALIRLLLDTGADIHSRGYNEMSALHYAARSSHPEAISLLIDKGSTVDLRDKYQRTPLHHARGKSALALLESGAVMEARDIKNRTPMHHATLRDDLDAISVLAENGASVEARDIAQETPLHYAVRTGGRKVVLLLRKGASLNPKDSRGRTPLRCISNHHPWGPDWENTANILIKAGADVNVVDGNGVGLLHSLAREHGEEALALFLDAPGADINARDGNGRAPLHYAVQGALHRVQRVKLLADRGADVNAKDINGKTPLEYLLDQGRKKRKRGWYHSDRYPRWVEAAQILIKAGGGGVGLSHFAARGYSKKTRAPFLDAPAADINARDVNGRAALHYAVQGALYRVWEVKLLVDMGADVNAKDINGKTPLGYLLERGGNECKSGGGRNDWYFWWGEAVQILIKAGADPKPVEKVQVGLLHLAASKHGTEILALLLDAGADINARDGDGQVPLDHAAKHMSRKKAKENIQFLLARGADRVTRDTNKNTTLQHSSNRKRKRD